MNVVEMAAADHSYWLAEGQHHGLAMTQVNRMLLINNCDDTAMRYYDLITPGRGGPQALGLCGPTQNRPRLRPEDSQSRCEPLRRVRASVCELSLRTGRRRPDLGLLDRQPNKTGG